MRVEVKIRLLLLLGLLLFVGQAYAQTTGEGACTWSPCAPSVPVAPNAVLTTDPAGNILFSQVLPSGMVVAPQCVTTANASGSPDAIQIPKLPCVPTTTLLVLTTNGANTTTAPTIQFPGGQPQIILRWTGAAMAPGDIPGAGAKVELTNNGKNWFLMTLVSTGGGGGTGTVTSVGLTEPGEFNVAGSPVTTSGTLAVTKANETANTVWAGPTSGGPAQPTFRALVSSDLPPGTGMGTVTSVGLTEPVEFTVSGSPVTTSGNITVAKANETANTVWAGPSAAGPAAPPSFRPLTTSDLPPGIGTVTSVGLAAPSEFAVSGSPVTGTGTLTLSKATELANTMWAGPVTGSAAAPTFRALTVSDLPSGLGTVTNVGVTGSPCLTASPSPITTTGTISIQVPLTVPCGGTGDTTLAAHSPLLGEGASAVATAAVGTAGRYLRDNGASADASFTAVGCADLPAGGCPFDITVFMPGAPANNAIARVAITRNVSCPTGFTGSVGIAKTAATGSEVVNVNQVTAATPTLRGTLTWSATGTVATVASSAGITLAANDIVEFAFPATADTTLADIAITLKCART